MPTNLLILPFLGGYWFLHRFYLTRYKAQSLDGYRLLVESALCGMIFTIFSWCACRLLWQFGSVRDLWNAINPHIDYAGTALGSLCIGLLLPFLGNLACRAIRPDIATEAQVSAITRHGNSLLKLLASTAISEQPVAITLDSRKVYVGSVAVLPNLDPRDAFVGIIPFLSGFRDKDDLTLHWSVDYLSLYESEHLPPEQFQVVVPINSIRTASPFDQSIYSYFVMSGRPEDRELRVKSR